MRCVVVTDLSQQELRLQHAAAVEASRDAIYALDERLVIRTWNRGAEEIYGFTADEAIGRNEAELCPQARTNDLRDLVRRVEAQGGPACVDAVRRRKDGSEVQLIYTLTPLAGRAGRTAAYSVVAHDITARKEAEEQTRFLMRELDHRAKNLLASIQAMIALTARSHTEVDELVETVESRIGSMARAHSLVASTNWKGVELRKLLEQELRPFAGQEGGTSALEGPTVALDPEAAMPLAMIVHELTINAVKHGAWSVPTGRIDVRWTRTESGDLWLEWKERGGPPVETPSARGFGSSVIGSLFRAQAGGDTRLAFEPDGLCCRIRVPGRYLLALPATMAAGGTFGEAPRPASARSARPARILLVEDNLIVALDIKTTLEALGYEVVGPAETVGEALALAEEDGLHAAVLDLRLHDDEVLPVADLLAERGVPFAFASGYDTSVVLPEAYRGRPSLTKPFSPRLLDLMLRELVA
jgi:PAS domain S-box-containing protein